jgi:branched-chain amino acid transport system permease protein
MTRDWKWWAWRVGAVVVLGTILLVLPQQYQAFRVNQFNLVITYAIAALGLNLLTGYNGQISVGHGAFYGVGAYTTVILVADYGWPHLGTVAVAAAITFLLGMLVGLPALRIHGLYLALVTLALATVFPQIIVRFSDFTGGTQGKRIPRGDAFVAPDWTGLADDQWRYYVLLTFAVVAFVLVRNLVRSRAGRAIIAIRDNPTAAATLGVHVSAYKVLVFGVSAMLAGVAGSLSTFYSPFVSSGQYNINLSIFILVAVVVGGASTIMGPAVGAFLVVFVPVWLDDFDAPAELSPIVFGASLILLMMVAPGGILGLVRRLTAWVKRRTARTPSGPPPTQTAEPLASTS